jgi:hypothetical protein
MARTCKDLRGIAQPVLMRCHTRCGGRPPETLDFQLMPYIRTILKDPGLARREALFAAPHEVPLGQPKKGDISILDEAAHRLGMPPSSEWSRRYDFDGDNPSSSILVQIILANLPNLEQLTLPEDFDFDADYLRPGSLPSLKKAELGPGFRPPSVLDLAAFETLFCASTNLEVLDAAYCIGCFSPLPLGNILSLCFSHSILSSRSLHHILRSCPRLQNFAYSSVGCPEDDDEWWEAHREATPDQFVHALLIARHSLKGIDITIQHPRRPLTDDFTGFEHCQSVALSQQMVWQDDDDDDGDGDDGDDDDGDDDDGDDNDGDDDDEGDDGDDDDGNGQNTPGTLIDLLPRSTQSLTLSNITFEFMLAGMALAKHVRDGGFQSLKRVELIASDSLSREILHAKALRGDIDGREERLTRNPMYISNKSRAHSDRIRARGANGQALRRYELLTQLYEAAGVEITFRLPPPNDTWHGGEY